MESRVDLPSEFNRTELVALAAAAVNGWLTLTPAIGDRALAQWQDECERSGKVFAVVRLEPQRATLWLVLTDGREWTQAQRARILDALSSTTGYVVTSDSARALIPLGGENDLMRKVFAALETFH